ncbi:hypothetical protein HAZT_HAZT007217 [Hyalella azteca]|uniref:Innexin n=1 Tax=Hyalella azteca TaxID=294128 RepID=A0A6A0H911_HYAAZ|nr:hypothetical protein HAZT_HAZT007217 [Hyalella azteca]
MAALFYLPKLIWNTVEGGLMGSIANGLNKTLYKDEDVGDRKKVVVEYIITHIKVVNYSNMDQTERVDPMIYIFPRMTKCIFHKYGSSGSIERHDAFCLLPLNILNEKIFILQWFWFIFLATLFGLLIVYRIMLLALPGLRPRVMHQHNRYLNTLINCRAVPMEALEAFTSKTRIGDWWILYVLSKNIDPLIYKDIMSKLAKEIETNASNNPYPSSAPSMFASSSV